MYELMIEKLGCHFRHIVFRDVAKSDIIFKLCQTERNIFKYFFKPDNSKSHFSINMAPNSAGTQTWWQQIYMYHYY